MVGGGIVTYCFLGGAGLPAKPVQVPDAAASALEFPAASRQGISAAIQPAPLAGTKVSSVACSSSPVAEQPAPGAPVFSITTDQFRANVRVQGHSGKAGDRATDQSAGSGTGKMRASPVPGPTALSAAGAQRPPDVVEQVVELPLPAAFVPAPAGEPTTAAQLAAVQSLQQQFNEAVNPYAQTATDAVYEQKWTSAQRQNDQMFNALMGQQAFLARERQANMNGQPSQP